MENEIIKVALTGASGSMGSEALRQILVDKNIVLRILLLDDKKNKKFGKSAKRKYKDQLEIVYGDLANYESCVELIKGTKYVFHVGAMIPPTSDHHQERAKKSNYLGTKNIVDAIRNSGREDQIYLVAISTVALYGNRNYKHMWARVGDPLLVSSYDYYALYKLKAERYLLDANLKHWVSLRQTAILHKNMFKNNMDDGLMFHTSWNAPLEWVTDVDSGRLLKNLLDKDLGKTLKTGFWNNIYNIGGMGGGRVTGYETLDAGFALMGSTAKKFFKPNWNGYRNFHGTWFYDSPVLNDYLDYVKEDNDIYWKRMGKKYWYFKFGAIVPASLISKMVIQPLFKNTNSPMYWHKHDFKGRIDAFYGSEEMFNKIGTDWRKFPLVHEGNTPEGKIDYEALKNPDNAVLLDHGYDEKKPLSELTLEDMKKAAKFRGGKCLSKEMTTGDMWTPLKWECSEGHKFEASPFTVLIGGHWCMECLEEETWRFDTLAPKSKFFAQVWYDSHDISEQNRTYPYDKKEISTLDEDKE